MSKFTKEEQTEIVRWALNLEAAIESEQTELSRLRNEKFRSCPSAPERKIINQTVQPVKPKYPDAPKTDYSFTQYLEEDLKGNKSIFSKIYSSHPFVRGIILQVICGVLLGVFVALGNLGNGALGVIMKIFYILAIVCGAGSGLMFPGAIVYWFMKKSDYKKKKSELNAALAKQPEYVNARIAAERKAKEQEVAMAAELKEKQESLDRAYKEAKENYDMVVVPQYNQELEQWTSVHELKIKVISDDLKSNQNALEELYQTTALISKNNRSLPKLIWLYDDMSTSEHDIERATDLLNNERQIAATTATTSAIKSMHADMQAGFNSVYSAIEEGNYVTSDMASELAKTRRDIDRGIAISGVQRHNTNRHLKSTNKMFEELSKKFD